MMIRLVPESTGIAYFPGLAQPVTIDLEQLPAAAAQEIWRLIEAADFFALPEIVSAPPRARADVCQYSLTVEDDGRCNTVRLSDPTDNPDLQALLDVVRAEARARRAAATPAETRPAARPKRRRAK